MAYTALDIMREKNKKKYGIDGPRVPKSFSKQRTMGPNMFNPDFQEISEFEEHVLHFIRERCTGLRLDSKYDSMEDREGASIKENMIPYNMEKDLDRLCLENAIHRFMESGVAEDAFDVYYIYLDMFIGKYSKSKRMIEKLSEFESNASSLLMSHRDHYSHSVYVFLIGLAVYDSSESYRDKYNRFFGLDNETAAHHFIKYWGLTSLFHDIGYPFELPFEEVMSYFDGTKGDYPYISYRDMDRFIQLDEDELKKAVKLTGGRMPKDMSDILTGRIAECLQEYYGDRPKVALPAYYKKEDYHTYLGRVFEWKSKDTAVFGNPGRPLGYMDHAYFSALVLMKNLFDLLDADQLDKSFTDALTAIVLHNSIFKHVIQNQKSQDKSFDYKNHALCAQWHPLSYLLMLSDELQCWDRTSYGQNSRSEIHAMGCNLTFNGDTITAEYLFDEALREKAERKNSDGKPSVGGTYKKMITKKEDGVIKFQRDIEEIVALNRPGELTLKVDYKFTEDIKYKKKFLSQSNFMHLYDFAVILSGRKKFQIEGADKDAEKMAELEKNFERKSLEYKLIDIDRVKKLARYLDSIDCFYTDRPVGYPLMTEFEAEDMDKIGPQEHERWLWIHHIMGWFYDTKYTEYSKDEILCIRELTHTHKLMLESETYTSENAVNHYKTLPPDEQDKDTEPMNHMLKILTMMDGVKFYRLEKKQRSSDNHGDNN